MEKLKLLQQAKAKRIQYHQTSFTTNAKGPSLVGNTRERKDLQKQTTNNKEYDNKNIHINTYLNVNGLMLQPKDADWMNGYKNKNHIYAVYKRPT